MYGLEIHTLYYIAFMSILLFGGGAYAYVELRTDNKS